MGEDGSGERPAVGGAGRLRFGGFELVGAAELRSAAGRVPLQPQPLRLLLALLQRRGEVVTRDELRRILWGDLHVDHEHGLNFAVRQLRIALADSADAPRFIETVPKVGYRFLAAVEEAAAVDKRPASAPARPAAWPVLAALTALGAALAALFTPTRADAPPRVLVRPIAGAPGLSDGVIQELARVPPSRLAVFAPATAAVGDPGPLRATHVVEGGPRGGVVALRLTATGQGRVLWAGPADPAAPYEAARLARAIALALDAPAPPARPRPTGAALQEGWRLLRGGTPEHAARAQALFAAAAQADVRSAEAQAGLAESARRLPHAAGAAWRDAALRAVALDPDDVRGHLSLAGYRLYRERDLAGSRAAFERALVLAPGLAAVHDAYAAWYAAQGRHEEALTLARRAAELDPLSTGVQLDLGWYLYLARRHGEAADTLERAYALEGQPGCLDYALRARLAAGEWDRAAALARQVMEARSAAETDGAGVRAAPDPQEAVRRYLRWNLARLRSRGGEGAALALEHAWLGDGDAALRLLEDDFAAGGTWILCFLAVDPAWDGLRSRPDFVALIARAGIAPR